MHGFSWPDVNGKFKSYIVIVLKNRELINLFFRMNPFRGGCRLHNTSVLNKMQIINCPTCHNISVKRMVQLLSAWAASSGNAELKKTELLFHRQP